MPGMHRMESVFDYITNYKGEKTWQKKRNHKSGYPFKDRGQCSI